MKIKFTVQTINTMEYQDIIIEQQGAITIITLNRPASLNALTPLMIRELKNALKIISADKNCKVLILKGAGRAFSAGVDLKAMNESLVGGQFTSYEIIQEGNEIANILRMMPQPAIVQVHGHCYTGATELMMFFDLIVACRRCKNRRHACQMGHHANLGNDATIAKIGRYYESQRIIVYL
jgi:enoyl-CoA hydratase/carnithine racemase